MVCNSMDTNQIIDIDFEMMDMEQNYSKWMHSKYETFNGNQTNVVNLIRLGIENGCQVKENINSNNYWI